MTKAIFFGKKEVIHRVYDAESLAHIRRFCDIDEEIVINKENLAEYAEYAKDAVYAFSTWGMPHFTVEEIKSFFPSLRALFYGAGTVKDFGAEFLEAGVRLFSAWGANAIPVVEYSLSQILLANKGFFSACRLYSANNRPDARKVFEAHRGNYGAKVGLLGLGMIGAAVAESLKAYKLEVLAFDPFCSEEKARALGAKLCSLEEIFRECDVISNHLANKPETVGIINASLLSSMKDTVTFINTGRGAQVDEDALVAAMEARPFGAAVLDVTDPEPPVAGSPLYGAPNIFLTPHIAGSAGDEVHRMAAYMAEECEHVVKGEPCRWEVSLSMLKTMA